MGFSLENFLERLVLMIQENEDKEVMLDFIRENEQYARECGQL